MLHCVNLTMRNLYMKNGNIEAERSMGSQEVFHMRVDHVTDDPVSPEVSSLG